MLNPPCKGCQRRDIKCHSTCDDYVNFHNERKKVLSEMRQEREINDGMFMLMATMQKKRKRK